MEDKRIKKTKKYLKDTLIQLLAEQSFEKITVTNLCERADVSRITFYSHYEDKYDLVEDIFSDMIDIGSADYEARQLANNRDGNVSVGFSNIMESILNLYYKHYDFFKYTDPASNPYLAFSFYNHIYATVEHHANKEGSKHKLKYSTHQITGFLCYGLIGFINGSHVTLDDYDVIKRDAARLLNDIMSKSILF